MIEFKVIKSGDFDKKLATLNKIPAQVISEGRKTLVKLMVSLRNAVQRDLKKPKTGKVYDWRALYPGETFQEGNENFFMMHLGHGRSFGARKRAKPHTASAPGEAPAIDTGEMRTRLFIDNRKNEIEFGSLSKEPPYPLWLEEGTKFMSARPWLEPVVKRFEPKIKNAIIKALNQSSSFGI